MNATIFDIQRFSIHDGPGIRTTVFFKGCPLRCAWCQNPESILSTPQELFDESKCCGCGRCRKSQSCPTRARRIAGEQCSPDEIVEAACRDRAFYGIDGGVTLCGGEPLLQWPAARAVAFGVRKQGIHCALDTCACAPERVISEASDAFDLIIADLKAVSPDLHHRWTGVDNAGILAAIRQWVAVSRLWISIPLIPGVHDSMELNRIADFIAGLPRVPGVRLIPYNEVGRSKYEQLGLGGRAFSGNVREVVEEARNILADHGIEPMPDPAG